MKLQQIRFVLAIAEYDLNISKAAKNLYTSQPGVSRQLRLLEEELGIQIFVRNGKQLVATTQQGKIVLEKFKHIMLLVSDIKQTANQAIPEKISFSEIHRSACA